LTRVASALALAVSIALVAPGCGTPPTLKLRIGVYPTELTAPVPVAAAKGFFRSSGLDVTVVKYASGPLAIKALQAGEVEVATSADYAFATSAFTDPDIRLLASIDRARTMLFVTSKGSGMTKTADLRGRRVGVPFGSVNEYALGSSLNKEGLTIQDVKLVNVATKDLTTALLSGSVDAVVAGPSSYEVKKALGDQAVGWSAQGIRDFYFTLISREGVLKEKPAVSELLMRSMLEAVDFIDRHPGDAKSIVTKAYKLDRAYLDYIWPSNDFEVSLSQGLMFQLDMEARWYKESGLAGASTNPDYLEFIDFEGLERTDPGAVQMVH
jgi:ABC-type nitrate/sulfonate/bicarbonate transport system substrate-binding protein